MYSLCLVRERSRRKNQIKTKINLPLRSHLKKGLLSACFLICLAQVTPYHNMKLRGVVHKTILRGNVVYERDRVCDSPAGQLLLETA